jgi:uncharacterized damage-inducible protein DinB
MAPQPAPDLFNLLEASRQDLLSAVGGISDAAARAKPDPARWSVLECMEHIVIVEERFQSWLEAGKREAVPPANPQNEAALFARVTDRSTRAEAPEVVRPTGKFQTIEQARAAFNKIRDRSVQMVRHRGPELYEIVADQHKRFGPMNGAELVHIIAGHSRRHAAQIREAVGS